MNPVVNPIARLLLFNGGTSIVPSSFVAPANQEIITEDLPYTVRVYSPSDSTVEIYDGITKLGDATSVGGGYWEYVWTPANPDFDVQLNAVGDVSGVSSSLTIVVDETNQINQNITTWSKSVAGITYTSGQPDPDGGNNAYKVALPVSAGVGRYIYRTMSSTSTEVNAGIEMWLKADGALVGVAVQTSGAGTAGLGYINIVTGEASAGGVMATIVEEKPDGWKRVWFRSADATNPTNLWYVYLITDVKTTNATITADQAAGGADEASVSFYEPRTADGVLPYTEYQKLSVYYDSVAGGIETWKYSHPTNETLADMDAGKLDIQVIKPTGWSASNVYPILYMLPALPDTTETSNGNSTPAAKAVAEDFANEYGCVVVVPQIRSAQQQWYGRKTNGSSDHHAFTANILTEFTKDFLGGSTSKEDHLLVGYSKSGFAAFSLLLRNPTKFGYAASWDGPFDLDWATEAATFGADVMFTTEANFNLYDPAQILSSYLSSVNDKSRLVLRGYVSFQTDQTFMKAALDAENIDYIYDNTLGSEHSWDGGWVNQTVADLFSLRG